MEKEGSVRPGSVKIIIKDNTTSAEKLVMLKKKKKLECFAIVAL